MCTKSIGTPSVGQLLQASAEEHITLKIAVLLGYYTYQGETFGHNYA